MAKSDGVNRGDAQREYVGREALDTAMRLMYGEISGMKSYLAFLMSYTINAISHINLDTGMYEIRVPEGYNGPKFRIENGYLQVVLGDDE